MRTTDFSPLSRSSSGFDPMLNAFEAAASGVETIDNCPPYDNRHPSGDEAYLFRVADRLKPFR